MFGGGMLSVYEWVRRDKKIYRNQKVDEFTFFTPDDQYLPIEDAADPKLKIYPESYFKILHNSMLPSFSIFDDEKEGKHLVADRVTGIASHSGSTFNIQFQVERRNEIRMYV